MHISARIKMKNLANNNANNKYRNTGRYTSPVRTGVPDACIVPEDSLVIHISTPQKSFQENSIVSPSPTPPTPVKTPSFSNRINLRQLHERIKRKIKKSLPEKKKSLVSIGVQYEEDLLPAKRLLYYPSTTSSISAPSQSSFSYDEQDDLWLQDIHTKQVAIRSSLFYPSLRTLPTTFQKTYANEGRRFAILTAHSLIQYCEPTGSYYVQIMAKTSARELHTIFTFFLTRDHRAPPKKNNFPTKFFSELPVFDEGCSTELVDPTQWHAHLVRQETSDEKCVDMTQWRYIDHCRALHVVGPSVQEKLRGVKPAGFASRPCSVSIGNNLSLGYQVHGNDYVEAIKKRSVFDEINLLNTSALCLTERKKIKKYFSFDFSQYFLFALRTFNNFLQNPNSAFHPFDFYFKVGSHIFISEHPVSSLIFQFITQIWLPCIH